MFKCNTCGVQAVSILQYKPGTHTWLCCVTLCIFGAFLAFLPFYMKDCQDVTHVCPACSQPVLLFRIYYRKEFVNLKHVEEIRHIIIKIIYIKL